MKQEDKELLLRYFSIALPYGLKMQNLQEDCPVELCGINWDSEKIRYYTYKDPSFTVILYRDLTIQEKLQFKPYLRPLVSMTEEERKIFAKLLFSDLPGVNEDFYKSIDYLNSIHVDYRGFIEKGLAIEVTEENNPYKD